ncbi:3'-5' exonuclease domain-containing protein 2 [Chitinimonas arctica]|uniref:3'-5' exonuclease domain-containing protein 2 n=1 Tax=Chitinimonas arctica TaxID=2594795 RepID=A0A516SJY9_9NEIS|nr:3'-5' exonuclease [Chitinimonas arctica]QDQ28475.1 3'-5' exonuclease domain-containing protein 2 [Chitinimonas arctica]
MTGLQNVLKQLSRLPGRLLAAVSGGKGVAGPTIPVLSSPPRHIDKAAILAMPPFAGLPLAAIEVVQTSEAAERACKVLAQAGTIGFDTESKPTFQKGEQSQGPHLIQLSTATQAFLFPVLDGSIAAPLRALLESEQVVKVGFDLRSDKAQMAANLALRCQGVQDLVPLFRKAGYRNTVGAVQAVALLFGQHYAKSKSVKMSNWATASLSVKQQRYAANDAYVALRAYLALANGHGAGSRRRS